MENRPRKKILYVITKSNFGGAQRYVFDLATHLSPDDFDVAVALGGTGELRAELEKKRIRIIPIQSLQRDISIFRELQSALELWRIVRVEKPDVLHINSSKAGGLGGLIGRLLRVPQIIFTAHGWAFNEDRPVWQKLIITVLHWVTVMLAHETVAVSEMTKRQMVLPFAQRRMLAIHNGRTVSNFLDRADARREVCTLVPTLRACAEDFWSVTVAELHHVKQHDVTIRALAQVVKEHPNVRHIVIGGGEERTRLESLVSEFNLGGNVFFTGAVPDAARYLKAFDLFVLSSRSEALAYVIIEACLAGLPIIASNVGGIPEVVRHKEEGLLFSSGDSETLAKYYAELYVNPTLRSELALKASSRGKDFSFEKMFDATVALYKS